MYVANFAAALRVQANYASCSEEEGEGRLSGASFACPLLTAARNRVDCSSLIAAEAAAIAQMGPDKSYCIPCFDV